MGQHLLPLIHETLEAQSRLSAGLVILTAGCQQERERKDTDRVLERGMSTEEKITSMKVIK